MKQLFKHLIVRVLTAEAKRTLTRHSPVVIAISGSVGKTSTKDAVYEAIKDSRPTRKSQKSFNSEIGVPLTILGLPNGWSNPLTWLSNCLRGFGVAFFSQQYPDVVVLETGVDQPGDMAALTKWLEIDIAIITSLPDVPVHVEAFADAASQRAEEFALVTALKPEGKLIYNVDDSNITSLVDTVRQEAIGFSRMLPASVRASKDEVVYYDDRPVGVRFDVQVHDEVVTIKTMGTVGLHTVYASAAALAVASELQIDVHKAAAALASQVTPPGRMRLLEGIKSSLILDDSYNSSPVAVLAALETLQELKYVSKRIAVLGDMLELGKFSSKAHRAVGERVAAVADVLMTIGPRSRETAAAALAAGMDEATIFQYETSQRAGRELQTMLSAGDVVLVKGSQRIRAEKIVEEVMAEPQRASELLCRQDVVWRRT